MFTANTTGLLTHYTGTDKFGQSLYEAPGTVVPCAVVKLQPIIQKTPIRSTASASRGEADELVEPATILFPSFVAISHLDKFAIIGSYLRCISVQPRIGMNGTIDHYECQFEVWEP